MTPIVYLIDIGHLLFFLSVYSEWVVYINHYCLFFNSLIYYLRFTEEVASNASSKRKSESPDPKN